MTLKSLLKWFESEISCLFLLFKQKEEYADQHVRTVVSIISSVQGLTDLNLTVTVLNADRAMDSAMTVFRSSTVL